MSYVSRCSFPYGHSVRPGQSRGSGDVQISTSCPRPRCLPIRRRVTTIVDFDPILLIPSQSPNIQQSIESVAETPPENPYTPTTCTEEPTSPLRPTHTTGRAEGAFFVSDFSRASKCTHLMLHIAVIGYLRDVDTHEYTITRAQSKRALSSLSRLSFAAQLLAPTSAEVQMGSAGYGLLGDCGGLAVELAQNHLGGHPRDGSGFSRYPSVRFHLRSRAPASKRARRWGAKRVSGP